MLHGLLQRALRANLLWLGIAAADSACPGSLGLGAGGTGFPVLRIWAGLGTAGAGQARVRSRAGLPLQADARSRTGISPRARVYGRADVPS